MSSIFTLLSLCFFCYFTVAFHFHPFKDESNEFSDRTYYIACVEEQWNYAPSGMNLITGHHIMSPTMHAGRWIYGTNNNDTERIGAIYYKGMYREYTDSTFTEQVDRETTDGGRSLHLGVVGPAIRGIVGDTVRIVYKNMCTFDSSMHPHGVSYEKTSEGAPYADDDGTTDGDSVAPGGNFTYFWTFRSSMIDRFTSSKMWLYHSHVVEDDDVHTGLLGPIIVTRKGKERSYLDLRPHGVDLEFVAFFVVFDENESHLFEQNVDTFSNGSAFLDDEDYVQSNLMHSINGYVYGNGEDFVMNVGDQVRWYLASFGNEGDGPHSPHWHGNIGMSRYESVDTVNLIPAIALTVDMDVDNEGKWLFHCHVNHHIHAGMQAFYDVGPKPDKELSNP